MLKENEQLDDLGINDYKIIQGKDTFRFGTDAVLLCAFATAKKDETIVDLGTGTGIIPILICARAAIKEIIGIEINEKSADMAKRSVELNGLENKIKIMNADLKGLDGILPKKCFDLVVCNPPYKALGTGIKNSNIHLTNARHEKECTLEDVIKVSSSLLRNGGRLCLVQRPERLSDILCLMRTYNLECKRLQLVLSKEKKEPIVILIEGKSGGKSGMRILPPLIIHKEDGQYTDEMKKIYGKG